MAGCDVRTLHGMMQRMTCVDKVGMYVAGVRCDVHRLATVLTCDDFVRDQVCCLLLYIL